MNETIHIELNAQQRELLLDGLSYLRSNALLEMRFPSDETVRDRERQIQEIQELAEQLGGSQMANTPASV